jgi:hypothetical protein
LSPMVRKSHRMSFRPESTALDRVAPKLAWSITQRLSLAHGCSPHSRRHLNALRGNEFSLALDSLHSHYDTVDLVCFKLFIYSRFIAKHELPWDLGMGLVVLCPLFAQSDSFR